MSLSLEVRKFINSEQTGEYAEVTLPSELPVEREELRAVHRDNAAADEAYKRANYIADARDAAENAKDAAETALETAYAEEKNAEAFLAGNKAKEAGLQPEFEAEQTVMLSAKEEYENVKSESDSLFELLKTAEEAKANAEKEYSEANSASAAKRAAYEAAKAAAEKAVVSETELREQREAARSAYAEAETISEKAGSEAELSLKEEKKSAEALQGITVKSVQSAGEKKLFEKQLQDAEKNEARLNREFNKLKSAYESVSQQRDSLKARSESAQSTEKEKEAVKLKLGALEIKANALKTSVEEKQTQYEAAVNAVAEAKTNFNECERRFAEISEELSSARAEYEAAKLKTAKAKETDAAEKAGFAGKTAALTALTEQYEKAAAFVSESKNAAQLASGEAAAADAEAERLKKQLEAADEEVKAKKLDADKASAVTNSAEKEYALKKAEFDSVNSAKEAAAAETAAAENAYSAAKERAARLEKALSEAAKKAENLIKEAEEARTEAVMLRNSVHVIETRYEKANIHYMESGKGEPIILVHSVGQSLYTFRKLFYKLAMSYRVIALDIVGHGYSSRPDIFEYGIRDHAECIARFMSSIGVSSAHFVAFSMGAAFVLELARMYPDAVGKLVLISPGGITPEMPLFVRMMESGILGGIASKLYGIRNVRKLIDESLFDHTVITNHDVDEYYKPASDPDGRYAIRSTIANYDESALLASLRGVSAETLIIWGADDKLHPAETAEAYNSALHNSHLTRVLNSGHLIHEEKPDKIYALIRKFIPAGYGDDEEN